MAIKNPTVDIKEPKTLPEPLKAWLASIQLTLMIIELNQRMGFTGKKQTVIPRLLWKLTIGELPPKEMTKELSAQLSLTPSAATALTKEMEEKFLRPMERPLRTELGIDTKLVYFVAPPPPPLQPSQPSSFSSLLIQTKEAAHPQERQVPTPPPVPPRPSEPTIKAEAAPEIKVPVNVKKSRVIWGGGNAEGV